MAVTQFGLRAVIGDVLRILIGLVWLVAAARKLRAPLAPSGVQRLLGGPVWIASVAARALPHMELLLGLVLLAGWRVRFTAALSAALFLVFAVLVGAAMIRGSLAGGGCGCFGNGPATPAGAPADSDQAVAGSRTVARNLVLAALACAVASVA